MIRRRLFVYAVMMTAGVTSGFFIVQKTQLLYGSLFMICCGIVVSFILHTEHENDCSESEKSTEEFIRELGCIIACLTAGFLLFVLSFISYESDLAICNEFGAEQTVTLEGRVKSVRIKDDSFRIEVSDAAIRSGDNEQREPGGTIKLNHIVLATYKGESLGPESVYELPGCMISMNGTLRTPAEADNPGTFDYRVYLRTIDTGTNFRAVSIYPLPIENQRGICSRIRHHFAARKRQLIRCREEFLAKFEDEQIRAFIKGVIFGDKTDIDEEIREDFNANSTGHILAVSGLHIGFLYSLLKLLAGRKRSLPLTILIISAVVVYGEMTLWSASTVRAVLVLSIRLMSLYVKRPFDLLTAVSTASIIILIREPYQLFNSGFQMSFLALIGIAFLGGPLSSLVGDYLGVMMSVQISVSMLAAYSFHRLNLLSVFINIPIIAVASVLVPICIITLYLSAAAGMLTWLPRCSSASSMLMEIAVKLSDAVSLLTIKLNNLLAGDGSFSANVRAASPGVIMLFYLILFIGSSEWCRVRIIRKEYRRILQTVAGALLISSFVLLATYNYFADDEIVFVSVGQGDCTHIRVGGQNLLIDGGGQSDYNIGEKTLMPYLLSNGAESVELAMVTHLHMDHYKGIFELSESYPVGRIGIPSDYRKGIEEAYEKRDQSNSYEALLPDRSRIIYLSHGERITVSDDVWVEPIWPLHGTKEISIDDPNENNMVYKINYKGIKIMVTGDLLEEDELKMIEYYKHSSEGLAAMDCDILKVAHHGSKSSSSEAFLDAVSPQIAVIQVGRNNFYGHPHKQTLERLEERGIKVYRTDLNGAAGIDIRKGGLHVDVMR